MINTDGLSTVEEIEKTNNLERLREQIGQMKTRLDHLDKVLNNQEKIVNLMDSKSKEVVAEIKSVQNVQASEKSVDAIMRNVFSNKKLPKILQKSE